MSYGRSEMTNDEPSANLSAEAEALRQASARLREYWGEAYHQLNTILFEEDPIGINFEENTNEYEPEVETILPRLGACGSARAVQSVLHEEFIRWFSPEIAGSAEKYEDISTRVWWEVMPLLKAEGTLP